MKKSKKQIWTTPWGYPEGWLIVIALFVVGLVWQLLMGPIPQQAVAPPFNYFFVSVLLLVSLVVGYLGHKRSKNVLVRFLISPVATITSIAFFMVLMVVLGLIIQVEPRGIHGFEGWIHSVGFTTMIHSYPFYVAYVYLLIVLGAITVRRFLKLEWSVRQISFLFNHFGLYLFLVAALLSGSEMKRYTMALAEGITEWRGMERGMQEPVELPIAIELLEFSMEEYPPKLMLYNEMTEQLMPKENPTSILLEKGVKKGRLQEWRVEILDYLPMGVPIHKEQGVEYVFYASTGAAHAAKVKVICEVDGVEHMGWVSCGSYMVPPSVLELDSTHLVVMPQPDSKQYYSDVRYYLPSGEQGEHKISVNYPLKVDGWYVYQLNYDQTMRRWATTTELELVHDRFLPLIYVGIGLMLIGALFLLLGPLDKKKLDVSI